MKKRIQFFLILIIIHQISYSQSGQPHLSLENLIPKSPQAAQMQRVSEVTVNLAKGIPDISFNLYTASVGNLKIPISIKYDASGIKYDDIPSSVGLKWSLLAGGQVSRSINGRPDETDYFSNQDKYSQTIFSTWNMATDSAQSFSTLVGENSTEISHDQYSYTYLDNTGSFYWRKNKWWDSKEPFTTKIITDSLYYPHKMKIIDDFGNIAFFGYGNEEFSMPTYGGNGYVSSNIPSFGKTAFYLSKIKAYTKQEAVFEYDTLSFTYDALLSQAYVVKQEVDQQADYTCNCGESNLSINTLTNLFISMVIKKITTPNEEVQFYYSNDNTLSIYKRKLDSLTVKDKNAIVISRIHFKYGKYNTVNLLRLDEVWNFATTGDSLLMAAFHYNTESITGVNTSSRDVFNYNNGANNSSTLISSNDADFPAGYTSADRSINNSTINNGNLDTLYYSTGGKAAFHYSMNNIGSYYAPGVRVDSIKYLNNDNSISSQIELSYKKMVSGYQMPTYINNITYDNGNSWCPLKTLNSEIEIAPNSSPFNFYYDTIEIRKKGATSIRTQLSKEVYTQQYNCYGVMEPALLTRALFRNNSLTDTLQIESNSYSSVAIDSISIDWLYSATPYMPTRYYPLNGNTEDNAERCSLYYGSVAGSHGVLKPRANLLTEMTVKEFDQSTNSRSLETKVISGYNGNWQKVFDKKLNSKDNIDSTVYTYLYTNAGSLASSVTSDNLYGLINKTTRYTNSSAELEGSRVSFSSHSSLILPDSFLIKTLSNSEVFNQYISAYDTSGHITEIESKRGDPTSLTWDYNNELVIAQTRNARVTNVAYTSFEADGKGTWSFSGSASIHPSAPTGRKGYSLSGGNITKSSLNSLTVYIITYWKRDSSSTVTVNSGSGTLIATKNGWKLYSHEITGITTLTISGTAYIDELRLYPKFALMTTYTYNPLIGITTKCDAAGRMSYFEYDSFNRLKHIKDEDGNILKRIDYKYNATNQQ